MWISIVPVAGFTAPTAQLNDQPASNSRRAKDAEDDIAVAIRKSKSRYMSVSIEPVAL